MGGGSGACRKPLWCPERLLHLCLYIKQQLGAECGGSTLLSDLGKEKKASERCEKSQLCCSHGFMHCSFSAANGKK